MSIEPATRHGQSPRICHPIIVCWLVLDCEYDHDPYLIWSRSTWPGLSQSQYLNRPKTYSPCYAGGTNPILVNHPLVRSIPVSDPYRRQLRTPASHPKACPHRRLVMTSSQRTTTDYSCGEPLWLSHNNPCSVLSNGPSPVCYSTNRTPIRCIDIQCP